MMSSLLARRGTVHDTDAADPVSKQLLKRSSSLPPQEAITADHHHHNRRPSGVVRGRHNPIGTTSRQSRSFYARTENTGTSNGGGGGTRAQSLTRAGSAGAAPARRGGAGSDIFEPSWFRRAFAGDDGGGGDNNNNSNNKDGAREDERGGDEGGGDDVDDDDVRSTTRSDGGGQRREETSKTNRGDATATTVADTESSSSSRGYSYSMAAVGVSGTTGCGGVGVGGGGGGYSVTSDSVVGSSTTSFTGHGRSIQSELLGSKEEEEEKLGKMSCYKPKSARGQQQDHDSCGVSSITMDFQYGGTSATQAAVNNNEKVVTAKKSKSFVTNMKKSAIIDKIKKKSRSFHRAGDGEFERSETSLQSASTAGSSGTAGTGASERSGARRGRGRSLGLKMKRGGSKQNGGENPHPYVKRRSRSQAAREDLADDQRRRDRSNSIVRDARSFIDAIEKGGDIKKGDDGGGNGRGRRGRGREVANCRSQTNESFQGSSSTIGSGNNKKGISSSRNRLKDDEGSSGELLSNLRETNLENQSLIEDLQEQLTDLTNERNAFRNNSERMMEIMTRQKSQLEKELKTERKGFAETSHGHKKEVEEWKSKVKNMEKKCERLESEVRERPAEVRGIGGGNSNARHGPLEKEANILASSMGIDISSTLRSDATQAERNLHRALLTLSRKEYEFNSQIRRLGSENEDARERADEYKEKYDALDKEHQNLLEEHDDETSMVTALENKLEGCRIVIESLTKDTGDDGSTIASVRSSRSQAVNDELVEKIGDLADENGRLVSKCQRLERDATSSKSSLETRMLHQTAELEGVRKENMEATTTIETLRVENRNLLVLFASQGENSRRTKNLMDRLRCSLSPGDNASAVLEDDESLDNTKRITEVEHEEALAMIKDMQAENDTLHKLMEESITLASGMNEKISNVVSNHEVSVREHAAKLEKSMDELREAETSKEELSDKLDSLKKENKRLTSELEEANRHAHDSVRDEIKKEQSSKEAWNREKREMSSRADGLKKENEKLHESMKEMNSLVAAAEECVDKLSEENSSLKDAQDYYRQQLEELNIEKDTNASLREEIKGVSLEREEAYVTCKVLQQEINLLRQSVEESKERLEILRSEQQRVSSASSLENEQQQERQMAELVRSNRALTDELEQKNEALQAVQSALENLKDEQATIKETIMELRAENARLSDLTAQATQKIIPPPPAPKSILNRQSSSSITSDSSQILRLESRIKKVAKENKGLREANSTLSAKLFDEMEKTDALRTANEGLAARICKLVAFIQQKE